MLRGWLVVLAVLVGLGFSFAADTNSPLLNDQRWAEARKHLAAGKIAEAKADFESLVAAYPKEPDLFYGLALTGLRLRDPQAAEKNLKQALLIDSNHVQARTLLGWIELEIYGNIEAAIKDYARVLELRPDSPDAYVNLGAAYKKKGELDKALDIYNQALKRHPDYMPALSNRGWVFIEQQKWPEARQDFERVLKVNPADQGALQGLADVLEKTRDYAGAQAALSKLMAQSPNFVYWLQWGRIGLIRYWWVLLSIAIGFFLQGRLKKARTESDGGGSNQEA